MKQEMKFKRVVWVWALMLGALFASVAPQVIQAQNKGGAGKGLKKSKTQIRATETPAANVTEGTKTASADELPEETEMDLPGSFHHYYGQRVNSYKDKERKIAKLDIDGDMNYDGAIDNFDPADGGAFEQTPPGLMLGVGELTKIIIRLNPYRVDFNGQAVVTAEVVGINRAAKSGRFDSFAEESAAVGRIRVWKTPAKKELILDSGNPEKRFHEWAVDDRKFPANLPDAVPRTVYVEGVSASGRYIGDLRLLFTVSHRADGGSRETYADYRKKLFKTFRTTFDHILFTVKSEPQKKVFINNNAEGVWLGVGNSTSSGNQ